MEQTVIKIGNSAGVVIPKSLRKQLGFRPGAKVWVEQDPHSHSVIITKKGEKARLSSITPEFLGVLERINQRYGPALQSLARK